MQWGKRFHPEVSLWIVAVMSVGDIFRGKFGHMFQRPYIVSLLWSNDFTFRMAEKVCEPRWTEQEKLDIVKMYANEKLVNLEYIHIKYYIAIQLCLLARVGTFTAKVQNSFMVQFLSLLFNCVVIAIGNIWTNEHGSVPIKLYLQK